MNSKEFNQRKREAFPEEVALKNLKELTEAERAGLHLLMIQTSDPDEREDILAEAQKLLINERKKLESTAMPPSKNA